MSKLAWNLLTRKRGSSTQGVQPGKEDLALVTNTVTLIYGQRDAVLVDTFLSEQHSKELVDWVKSFQAILRHKSGGLVGVLRPLRGKYIIAQSCAVKIL